ncbi:jg27462, partial [Pararge aegeria aegeria]
MKLEENLDIFLKHEANIVHQYQTIKSLKDNLTEKDAVIHMDFSENYNTKYSSEVQSFHFGGSRTQISLHTVVLYTQGEIKCFATISENLNHNVPVIWAHLKPVMELLPTSIENVYFLSDGPVTQYRNKDMFFFLLCKLNEAYPNICDFTWNYHEAGHGKGAPDGIGGTCKRTADKIVALGTDIASIDDFATELNKYCPGIQIFVITEQEIDFQKKIMEDNRSNIKPFTGTLKVHQVRGSCLSNMLYMKSLSCF